MLRGVKGTGVTARARTWRPTRIAPETPEGAFSSASEPWPYIFDNDREGLHTPILACVSCVFGELLS